MRIFAPESEEDMEKLLYKAIYDIEGCVAVRYPYDQIHNDIKNLFVDVSEKERFLYIVKTVTKQYCVTAGWLLLPWKRRTLQVQMWLN